MREVGSILTYDMLKRAWVRMETAPEPTEYVFQWAGKVYRGPSYDECVMAAMKNTFPAELLRSMGID